MMPPETATTEVTLEDATEPTDPLAAPPQNGPAHDSEDGATPQTGAAGGSNEGTTSSATGGLSSLSLHPTMFTTLPGQLVCLEVIFSFLAFICIVAGYDHPNYWIFGMVAFFSFLWTVFVLVTHLFQLYRMLEALPWMTIELVVSLIFIILWFVADLVLLSALYRANSGAAIMCGLFAFLTFCASGYLGFTDYLNEVRKQGNPLPSATKKANKAIKAAKKAEGGDAVDGGGDDSDSEDSLSELPTVNPIY